MHLNELKNFQIIFEHTLQMNDGICAFYDHAKIRNLETEEEDYINEDLIKLIFPLFDKYTETQMKRRGIHNLVEEKAENKTNELRPLLKILEKCSDEEIETMFKTLKQTYGES